MTLGAVQVWSESYLLESKANHGIGKGVTGVLIVIAFGLGLGMGLRLGGRRADDHARLPTLSRVEPDLALGSSSSVSPASPPSRTDAAAGGEPVQQDVPAADLAIAAAFSATISGRVVNARREPEVGAFVQATMVEDDRDVLLAAWQEGEASLSALPFIAHATSRSDGTFLLRGLKPGSSYRVSAVAGLSLIMLDRSQEPLLLMAPQRGIELAVSQHEIELEIIAPESTPPFRLQAYVESMPERWPTNVFERSRLRVAAGHRYTLEIDGQGMRPATVRDLVLGDAEAIRHVTVALQEWSGNRVVLEVVSDRDKTPTYVRFFDFTSWGPDYVPELGARLGGVERASHQEGTDHVLADLAPGLHRLTVYAADESELCLGAVSLAVPEWGELRQRVVLKTGGRLKLRTEAIGAPAVACLFPSGWSGDPRGLEEVQWKGGTDMPDLLLHPGREYCSWSPIPPGTWELGLAFPDDDGHVSFAELVRAVRISIASGETTEMTIALSR
jgi:hypothetical protein